MKNKVVCVLGAYRSGTSMLTNVINKLGVDIGEDIELIEKVNGLNDDGFFQRKDVENFHNILRNDIGKSGLTLESLPNNWEKYAYQHIDKAESVIARFKKSSVWGFKSNLNNFFIPFWQKLFVNQNLDDYYLLIIRWPGDTIKSMQKAWGIRYEQARWVWYYHNLCALSNIQQKKHLILIYDELLTNTMHEIQKINDFIGIKGDVKKASTLIKSSKRHNFDSNRNDHELYDFYKIMMQCASGEISSRESLKQFNNLWEKRGYPKCVMQEAKAIIAEVFDERGNSCGLTSATWQGEDYSFKFMFDNVGSGIISIIFNPSLSAELYVKEMEFSSCYINRKRIDISIDRKASVVEPRTKISLYNDGDNGVIEIEGKLTLGNHGKIFVYLKNLLNNVPQSVKQVLKRVLQLAWILVKRDDAVWLSLRKKRINTSD